MFTKQQKIIIIGIVLVLLTLIAVLVGLKEADPQPAYFENQPAENAILNPNVDNTTFSPQAGTANPNQPSELNTNSQAKTNKLNLPPKKTVWLGPKFNKLTAVGADSVGGFGIVYVPSDYAKRLLGGDGPSQPIPIIVQTRKNARQLMMSIGPKSASAFDRSGSITVNGEKIQLYEYNTVAFIPFYDIDRVAVVQAYSRKLLKQAISNLTAVK